MFGTYTLKENDKGIITLTLTPKKTEKSKREYFPPIGILSERLGTEIWPGNWVDATGYATWYFDKWYHTGADLNLNRPSFDSDAHSPVYSIADGEVYAIRQYSGWDWVICIKHNDVLSRYAHIENIRVSEGDTVKAGQQIANIGNAGGRYPYHLHFDIAKLTARMLNYPGDWPGNDKSRVLRDYINPKEFLMENIK